MSRAPSSRKAGPAATEEGTEGDLEVGLDGGERLGETRFRRLVDAGDRLRRLRDRLDEIAPLRGQEDVPLFELVELLDGHHVHRSQAIDFCLESRDGFLGGHRGRWCLRLSGDRGRIRAGHYGVIVGFGIWFLGGDGCRIRRGQTRLLHLLDFRQNLVQRDLHGVHARLREVGQVALGGRALDLEIGRLGANRLDG